MAQYMSANSYLGLGIEATRGTLSSNLQWIPISSPQLTPMQKFIRDEALRGSPVNVYDQVAGVRNDEYSAKGYVYADTFPALLKAALGNETVTGSGTYTHTVGVLNNTSGSQPPSVSIQDFDGANAFQMLAAQLADLTITYGADKAAEWTAKFVGNPYTSISAPTATFGTTDRAVPGWNVAVSIAGTSVAYVQEGEIKIDRKAAPIFTAGTQAPRVNFAGPAEVSGRLLCVIESTSEIFSNASSGYALSRSPQALVTTLTDTSSSHTIAFTSTSCQFQDVKRLRGKDFVEVEVNFTANASTTDAVSGGYSPIKAVVTNAISTSY
jgi:hypothetical protein